MELDGRKLQKLQNQLGLSPTAVCEAAGVSMTTLYAVYTNKATVKPRSVLKVKAALDALRRGASRDLEVTKAAV
jgi:transcriptional regulator with XRE-family HTH domain